MSKASLRHNAIVFLAGMFCGALLLRHVTRPPPFPPTPPPFHISTAPTTGVSHNPEIKKQVLASYMQLPHVTQIAKSNLAPGQVASENWHKDMVEMFIFLQGEGILKLDKRNHSVTTGSISLIYPPTKHTIFNTGSQNLELLTIASVP